jgi:PBP1b-binding outer membrane lipoprotein LpoB
MKKVIVLAAIAAVFASCASDNKSNSGLLGGDSATVTVDSTVVDSVAFESMIQDTLATN